MPDQADQTAGQGEMRREFYDPVAAFPGVPRYWESPRIVGELMVAFNDGAGTVGEWSVKFYDLTPRGQGAPTVRVEAFADSIAALTSSGLLETLTATGTVTVTPADFAALLAGHGWHDTTSDLADRSQPWTTQLRDDALWPGGEDEVDQFLAGRDHHTHPAPGNPT